MLSQIKRAFCRNVSGFLHLFFPVMVIFCCLVTRVSAEDTDALSPVAKKAKDIVERACKFVLEKKVDMKELQQQFEKNPKFRDDKDELYIFMHSYDIKKQEVICIAQGIRPELVGKNMWGLRTPNGRLIFHEMFAQLKKHDSFWLEYEWLNPYTRKIQPKKSFFKKIVLPDGRTAWIGCGFWKE